MTPSLLNLQTLLACSPEIPRVRVHTAYLINLSLLFVFSISYYLHLFFISQTSRKSSLVQCLHSLPLSYSSIHSHQAPTARLTAWAVFRAESIGTFAHFLLLDLFSIPSVLTMSAFSKLTLALVIFPYMAPLWLLFLSLHCCTTHNLFYVF